jgi:hypothetical protein
MAYVVWRVLLKKYVQMRQGIHQQSIPYATNEDDRESVESQSVKVRETTLCNKIYVIVIFHVIEWVGI